MSPISFSDKFVLLSLKGSQNLIGKSSLGVVVDNIKLIDLFSALYVSCIKSRYVPYVLFISLMLQNDYSFKAKFLFFDENLRIPDLLTLLSLCFGTKHACDLNLTFLIPRLVSALTQVWKPVLVKTLTAVCSFIYKRKCCILISTIFHVYVSV